MHMHVHVFVCVRSCMCQIYRTNKEQERGKMRETITISQTAWLNLCLISQEVTSYCAASLSAIPYLTLCHPVLKREKGREKRKKKQAKSNFVFSSSLKQKRAISPACSQTSSSLISPHPSCIHSRSCYPSSWMNYISLFHLSQRLLHSLSASFHCKDVQTRII